MTSLSKAEAEEQVAAVAARISAVPVERDSLDALQTLVDELWESGSTEQATALAYRAAVCAGPDDPKASVLVARMLDRVEAEEFTSALLSRCPVQHAALTDPSAVFALLDALREAIAEEEIDALLAREPATNVECHDPEGVANLLYTLNKLDPDRLDYDPQQQIAALYARDLGALVALDAQPPWRRCWRP